MLYYVHPKRAASPISYTRTAKAVRILCVRFNFIIGKNINENSSADSLLTSCAGGLEPIRLAQSQPVNFYSFLFERRLSLLATLA